MKYVTGLILLTLVAGGCSSNAGNGALIGGLVGAGVGGAIGSYSHARAGEGALIGAGVGALAGGLIGHDMDVREQRERERYVRYSGHYDNRYYRERYDPNCDDGYYGTRRYEYRRYESGPGYYREYEYRRMHP